MSVLVYYRMLGKLGANCYFLINSETKECVIIDAGSEPKTIQQIVAGKGLKPVAILLTHGHFDHIMACNEISKAYNISIYAGENEIKVLKNPELNLSSHFEESYVIEDAIAVKDGQEIFLAGMKIKVIETAGHTSGGVCYYIADEKILISGDTLFEGSFGRCDFPMGDLRRLADSIKNKLFVLPGDTVCYPGHGGETTIEYEKNNNPILDY